MNELVCVGKIINFFGIKGELKILSDFDKQDLAFKIGMDALKQSMRHLLVQGSI